MFHPNGGHSRSENYEENVRLRGDDWLGNTEDRYREHDCVPIADAIASGLDGVPDEGEGDEANRGKSTDQSKLEPQVVGMIDLEGAEHTLGFDLFEEIGRTAGSVAGDGLGSDCPERDVPDVGAAGQSGELGFVTATAKGFSAAIEK